MNWAALGKILLLKLPTILSTVEKLKVPGANKKEIVLQELHDELHEYSPELAKHPKVVAALGELNDAAVKTQNVIAHVKNDIDSHK